MRWGLRSGSSWRGANSIICTQAQALLGGIHAHAVLADKGYDADELVTWIQQTGALVVIPPRGRNRTVLRDYDKALYKKGNQVEGMVGDLKHFSRVAVRQDSALLLSFVQLATSYLWLK